VDDRSVADAPYGSVESYAQILRNTKPQWLEISALAIVQIIAEDDAWGDGDKVSRIRNVVAAAERVRKGGAVTDEGLAGESGAGR